MAVLLIVVMALVTLKAFEVGYTQGVNDVFDSLKGPSEPKEYEA